MCNAISIKIFNKLGGFVTNKESSFKFEAIFMNCKCICGSSSPYDIQIFQDVILHMGIFFQGSLWKIGMAPKKKGMGIFAWSGKWGVQKATLNPKRLIPTKPS
jgi:hypothetical protein